MRIPLLFAVCWFATLPASAQGAPQSVPGERAWVKGGVAEAPISVPAPAIVPAGERTASFVVNYTGFSNEAQEAFQYAVDIWASLITSDVPIVIDATWEDLPGNTLGSAGATSLWYNFGGAPYNNVLYPSPLADKLAGSDLEPGSADMVANFDSGTDWYLGLDGNPPFAQYDLVSVVLHEIGHGLGFAGTMYVGVDLNGYVLNGSLAHIYDAFVYTGDSESVLDFGSGTAAMAEALLGDNLYWAGVNATAYSGEFSPKLYAPEFWEQGSSLSHFDEVTYPAGDEHSLMTPAIGNGEAVHSPGPMALGLLEDIGWTVDYDALIDDGGCGSDVDEDGICDDADDCIAPDLTPNVLPTVPATFIAEVTLDGAPVVGMTVYAEVDGETVGVDEAFAYEGGSWVSMSLYVLVGDDVDFYLFDEVTCTVYDDGLGLSVTEAGGELTTFFNPGSLPFTGAVIPGCTDSTACNFNPDAVFEDGSCLFPQDVFGTDDVDCDGACLQDADGDGVCDGAEVDGCTQPSACNFNPEATEDDGSCDFSCYGCTDSTACNFNPEAAEDDGSCDFSCYGCTDSTACNFNPEATQEDGTCLYPLDLFGFEYLDCNGDCLQDVDGDGVCDEAEVLGCTDSTACNFNPEATDEDGSCTQWVAESVVGPSAASEGDTLVYAVDPVSDDHLYNWILPEGATVLAADSGEVTVVWDSLSLGSVNVILVTEYHPECGTDTLSFTVDGVVGLEEASWPVPHWIPAPNPARDWVRLIGLEGVPCRIRLLSVDGREVQPWVAMPADGRVGLLGVAAGRYVLEVQSSMTRSRRPLVIHP